MEIQHNLEKEAELLCVFNQDGEKLSKMLLVSHM